MTRKGFRRRLARLYCRNCKTSIATDADPGLHAASEWLLRQWKQEAWLKQVNDGWAKDQERREKRLDGIRQLVTKDKEKSAAVVRQRSGTDDGGDPRPCGVSDGIAAHGSGQV